jgi:hypothetical protein
MALRALGVGIGAALVTVALVDATRRLRDPNRHSDLVTALYAAALACMTGWSYAFILTEVLAG